MYDSGKIIIGLVIFVVAITFPFWYNFGKAATPQKPVLEVGTTEKQCVEPTAWMRSSHMQLLDKWRDDVVRNGKRIYKSSTGKEYLMSLQLTCTQCHVKKEQFCDRCHNYVDVAPNCWDCHLDPKLMQQPQKQAMKE